MFCRKHTSRAQTCYRNVCHSQTSINYSFQVRSVEFLMPFDVFLHHAGIIKAETNLIVNPNQRSNFTCNVGGNPIPDEYDVHFYQIDNGIVNESAIVGHSSSLIDDRQREVVFEVESVPQGGLFSCSLGEGSQSVSLPVNASTYGKIEYPILESIRD